MPREIHPAARADNAKTYPAHDDHPAEQVTIAIDPYDSPSKSEIFRVKWQEYGYLPAYLVVSNDGDRPIVLTAMHIQWVTAKRSKLQPATEDDLARRLSRIKRRGDENIPLPLPLPKRGPSAGVTKDARQEIDGAVLEG